MTALCFFELRAIFCFSLSENVNADLAFKSIYGGGALEHTQKKV